MIHACYAGCDISAQWLDLYIETAGQPVSARFDNSPDGYAALVTLLRQTPGAALVLEASGGYEAGLLNAMWLAGLPVARVEAGRVRAFAAALAQRAKTDRIDAQVIARFGAATRPEPTPAPEKILHDLRALVSRRRSLVAMRADERRRLAQTTAPLVRASIERHIAQLDTEIAAFENRIAQLVQSSAGMREKAAVMRSMPGIGPATIAVLLAELPQLGHATGREIASLAGLAPFSRDSGKWRGRRFCSGGRKPPRDALYMAATSAAFHASGPFKDYFKRLRNAGKPHKVALVALMRKMLVTLNAMIKNKQSFNA